MATPANAEAAANVPVLLRKSRRDVEEVRLSASLIIGVIRIWFAESIDSAIPKIGNF
jgi:hypothetical protein